ncbi:Replication termination factor 2 [Kickxella alabastrina]|nr:Replication termination factor 2 [Kickxella alabastrina]
MGNDGGSIPRRSELVREKKKDEKADRKNQLQAMTTNCSLSKRPLRQPIVSDALGRLYNRESVLEYLLDNRAFGDGSQICAHIKGLKDIKTLQLKDNPSLSKHGSRDSTSPVSGPEEAEEARFVCPVTMKEMNGNLPFEFAWSCGCVFSAMARREMGKASGNVNGNGNGSGSGGLGAMAECVVCGQPVLSDDIIPINSQDAQVLDTLRSRMAERRRREDDERKSKKAAKKTKTKPKGKRGREEAGQEKEEDEEDNGGCGPERKHAKK